MWKSLSVPVIWHRKVVIKVIMKRLYHYPCSNYHLNTVYVLQTPWEQHTDLKQICTHKWQRNKWTHTHTHDHTNTCSHARRHFNMEVYRHTHTHSPTHPSHLHNYCIVSMSVSGGVTLKVRCWQQRSWTQAGSCQRPDIDSIICVIIHS